MILQIKLNIIEANNIAYNIDFNPSTYSLIASYIGTFGCSSSSFIKILSSHASLSVTSDRLSD